MTQSDVLMALYSRHHDQPQPTGVASSHWREKGALTRVSRHGGRYELSGVGFGTFVSRHSVTSLKQFLPNLRARALLGQFQVDRQVRLAGRLTARKTGRVVSFDCVKQILAVDLLRRHGVLRDVKTAVVVGDGYGYMTALLGAVLPEARIVCVNLGNILFFDAYYVGQAFPNEEYGLNAITGNGHRFIFLEAEHYEALRDLPVDVFINIASMQEMDMGVIRNYFRVMRSGKGVGYFYCCNRVEKTLPDGSVIRFDAYPWDKGDQVLVDELCPWYQRRPVLKPPFWRPFGGPIQHRLVQLRRQHA